MEQSPGHRQLSFVLNGEARQISCADSDLLLDVLRDGYGLMGVKRSCDVEICGTCTVLVDGQPVSSCATLVYEVDGRRVVTVEGLAADGRLHPMQQAFMACGAVQCGYCTPGMLLTAVSLLDAVPRPTRQRVIEELEGNICRCTGYVKIVDAILAVSSLQESSE